MSVGQKAPGNTEDIIKILYSHICLHSNWQSLRMESSMEDNTPSLSNFYFQTNSLALLLSQKIVSSDIISQHNWFLLMIKIQLKHLPNF